MNDSPTPAQKAVQTHKSRRASRLAHIRTKSAKTFAKYVLAKQGCRVPSFGFPRRFEYRGIVDLVAVKRHRKDLGELRVVLIQVKGGTARVTLDEICRLRKATDKIEVAWNVAEKPKKQVRFVNSVI